MIVISRRHVIYIYKTLCRRISSSSGIKKSHYEVLNLPKTCSDKEIKDAFIKLSKMYHPDRNKHNTNEAFIRVMEAYSVLGKPHLRAKYDVRPVYTTTQTWTPNTDAAGSYGRKTGYRTVREDYTTYGFRAQDFASKQKVAKRNNNIVVLICFGVAVVGFILQMFIITSSAQLATKRANEKTKIASEHLARSRAAAILNGNDGQSQILMEKISRGAGPSEATAALAETLVDTSGKH